MRPFPLPSFSKPTVRKLFILILLLSIPAFLINLSMMTFIEDEAIRSLVALEMWYNGDFISPTLNNTPYFKKPPLYNWILVLSSQIFGYFGELPARVPTLVFLGLFGYTVYRFYRPKWGLYPALILCGLLITSGRILFWESLLGLIDICFSWIVFMVWAALYKFVKKEQYWFMYGSVWILTGIGFLLKGLPVIVFTGLSVSIWLLFERKWKKLYHPAQFAGFGIFLLIVGTYYTLFAMQNNFSVVLATLWSESSQRTPLEYGLWKSILHLFEFPLEMFYHFLPWSVFLVFLRKRSFWDEIWNDRFLRFHFLMIAGNIWVYWISPQVYPRYLLMFIPFFSALCIAGYFREKAEDTSLVRAVEYLFGGIMVIGAIGALSPFFIDRAQDITYLSLKSLVICFAMAAVAYAYFKFPAYRLLSIIGFLLILRIGFNWFILPPRNAGDWANQCRHQSKQVGQQYRDQSLYLWHDSMYYTNSFYISKERNEALEKAGKTMHPGNYYIVHSQDTILQSGHIEIVDSFCIRHKKQFMKVVKVSKALNSK